MPDALIMTKQNKNNLEILSQTSFPEMENVIELCKHFRQNTPDSESKTILDYYLSSALTCLTSQEISFIKNHNKSTWVDYLIYRYKFNNYGKLGIIPKFPLYLLIEPTSICNLRCSMCYQTDNSFSSNNEFMGMMNFELFTKIIDEAVAGGTKAVTLASRGEPTLHPLFGEMLNYCMGKFYEIKTNTNALRLNTKLAHKILKSKTELVVFSVDAYDSEGYKKVRNSDRFLEVVENVKNFHDIRARYYSGHHVVTRAHGVKVDPNFDSKKFYSFWRNITDEVTLIGSTERWDTYNNSKTNNTNPCSVGLDRMYIWHDGTCNPCDPDYKSYLKMGNIKDNTISAIWNGSNYETFRKTHFDGNRLTLIPCDRCEL